MQDTKNLIYKMLTENTGRAICDSGGAYGRNWERNQSKTLADFENEAPAQLSIDQWHDGSYSFDVTISVFHRLAACLELDDLCNEFNALSVDDWDGDYYGTSAAGFQWLNDNGLNPDDDSIGGAGGFNTYNFDGVLLSQVLQGHFLRDDNDGGRYVLLQIHGGCDVRGGYTNAKLLKLRQWIECWNLFDDYAMFSIGDSVADYRGGDGGFCDDQGEPIPDDQLQALAATLGKCTICGDIAEY